MDLLSVLIGKWFISGPPFIYNITIACSYLAYCYQSKHNPITALRQLFRYIVSVTLISEDYFSVGLMSNMD